MFHACEPFKVVLLTSLIPCSNKVGQLFLYLVKNLFTWLLQFTSFILQWNAHLYLLFLYQRPFCTPSRDIERFFTNNTCEGSGGTNMFWSFYLISFSIFCMLFCLIIFDVWTLLSHLFPTCQPLHVFCKQKGLDELVRMVANSQPVFTSFKLRHTEGECWLYLLVPI